mgnify:CR=1 FL=1|tara:strand:- start:5951 stop:6433 length:483 start_codon:yes stop_codon:yes gene_type:complete
MKTIKITNMQLLTDLGPSLNELKAVKMNGKTTIRIVKTLNNVFAALNSYDATRKSLIEIYVERDEKGNLVTQQSESGLVYKFKSEEDTKKAAEVVNAIANEEVSIDIFPITEEEVEAISEISVDVVGRLAKYDFILVDKSKQEEKREDLKAELRQIVDQE